jgi:hypothetical protein
MNLKSTQEKIADLRAFYRWMPDKQFKRLVKKMYLANRPTFESQYYTNDKGVHLRRIGT